jgi:hypothetical protein
VKLLRPQTATYNVCVRIAYAASHGGTLRVEVLINAGAHVNARCALGETPLHAAARRGRGAVIALLASRGADVFAQSKAPAFALPLEVAGFAAGAPGVVRRDVGFGQCDPELRAAACSALYAAAPSLRTCVVTHPDCLLHANRPGHQARGTRE